jgi:hypothetical protein
MIILYQLYKQNYNESCILNNSVNNLSIFLFANNNTLTQDIDKPLNNDYNTNYLYSSRF